MRRDSYREVVRLLLLANAGVHRVSGVKSSVGPDRRKRNHDGRRRQSSLLPVLRPTLWPGKRENRITEVSVHLRNMDVSSHKLNMKETWESG